MAINEKLVMIQQELKAPKGQYNSFGKYKYRSCEDILEALKPCLSRAGCSIKLSDKVVLIGDRFYVEATVTLTDTKSGESTFTTALAREDDSKKGMDGSQITGTASSYARKYALNGLFAIDDTKDADTDEYTARQKAQPEQKAEPVQVPHWNTNARTCEVCGKLVTEELAFKSANANKGHIYCSGTCKRKAEEANNA